MKELVKKLHELNVKEGSVLYVASDVKTLIYKGMEAGFVGKQGQNELLGRFVDALQETVGPTGTLLFPIYSNDFCKGAGFDVRKTKGYTGTLSNWILKNRPDFKRTAHPTHSLMVWGQDAGLLAAMHNQEAWGHSSPFEYLREVGAYELFFNIEAHQGFTFAHYVEQCANVPYRHPKYFFGDYTDSEGITERRCYSMNVRDMEVSTEICVVNDWLVDNGVARQDTWQENLLTVADLAASYPILLKDMVDNNGANTIAFHGGYSLDWSKEKTMEYEIGGLSK